VRELVGAAMPLAGVGCAVATSLLERIAAARGGTPFDADSLVEDYELGLRAGAGTLARVREAPGRTVVAVREYFPATLAAAVRQKARWMHGIAFAGWDRTGWGRPLALGDHWMRLRDRRGPLSVLVVAAAYLALVLWGASAAAHAWRGDLPPVHPWLAAILRINGFLLCWRALVRSLFTARCYGWREAAWTLPRMVTGNVIAMLAARRALWGYLCSFRGHAPRWDKTRHAFPAELGGAGPA
jgi:adsorption protein B